MSKQTGTEETSSQSSELVEEGTSIDKKTGNRIVVEKGSSIDKKTGN